jgi:hypothetical protein
VTLLAHAGPGSTWQAMLVVAAVVLAAAVLLAAVGWLRVERADDLVVPLAVAAITSSLGTLAHEWLSDGIGWAVPLGVVALLALVLGALTPLEVRFPAPLPMGAVALAIVGAVALYAPLTVALHPPAELLPLSDDAEVVIVAPQEDATVPVGDVEVVVRVDGGSIGPGGLPVDALPEDPEEAGDLAVALAEVRPDGTAAPQQRLEVTPTQDCTVEAPCSEVTFTVPIEAGRWRLTVELTRGDGTPLAPYVRDAVTFDVG